MVALLAFLNKTVASYLQSEIVEIVKLVGGLKSNTVCGKATHFGIWPPMATSLWVSEEGV